MAVPLLNRRSFTQNRIIWRDVSAFTWGSGRSDPEVHSVGNDRQVVQA